MCQSLFFNKVAGLASATLLKKRLWHSCFPVNFCEGSKNNFSYGTPSVAASETLQNKRPIEAAVRIRSSKQVFLKISQISQVFSRENCEMLTFLQNNSGGCFLTQLLLHRKTRISLRQLVELGMNLLNFCILFCNSLLKSHRNGHQWFSIKKRFAIFTGKHHDF